MDLIKKYFDWTPRDIAAWEAIRSRGLLRFVLGYGLVGFGGLMFVLLGGAAVFLWIRASIPSWEPGSARFIFLVLELVFIAALCLAGGLVTSLLTWFMEEKIYHRYKARAR